MFQCCFCIWDGVYSTFLFYTDNCLAQAVGKSEFTHGKIASWVPNYSKTFFSLSLSLSPAPLLSRFARLPGQWMEGQRQETACRGPMVALAARARSGRLADRGRACNGALEVGRQHCSVWPLEAAALKQPGRVDRTYQQWQLWCQTYFMHLYSSCRK